ncbi:MAG: hypothetical protein GF414_01565 [Candidatus Altiarchaeales archaeon]|nr:hypothetical protein [Candidatus Altiarchaeales archaeon]
MSNTPGADPTSAVDLANARLTKKEKQVIEYWLGAKSYEAAARAGYLKPAGRNERRLLHDPHVKKTLAALSELCLEDLKARRGRLIAELESIAYSDLNDFVKLNPNTNTVNINIPADKSAAIKSFKETRNGVEIQLHDKLSAIEKLSKISGLTRDELDITSGGMPINRPPVNITFEVVPMCDPKEVEEELLDDGPETSGD